MVEKPSVTLEIEIELAMLCIIDQIVEELGFRDRQAFIHHALMIAMADARKYLTQPDALKKDW